MQLWHVTRQGESEPCTLSPCGNARPARYAKSHVDTNLLAVARQTLALWDKYGMGDEEEDSEPVYHLLKDAVNGYDYWRSRHDKPCPF